MNNLKETLIGKTIIDVEFNNDYYTYLKFNDGTKLQIAPDENYILEDDMLQYEYGAFCGIYVNKFKKVGD